MFNVPLEVFNSGFLLFAPKRKLLIVPFLFVILLEHKKPGTMSGVFKKIKAVYFSFLFFCFMASPI